MRGALLLLAALALALNARADMSPFAAVDALATEKAAAVALLQQRSERQVALAAGDRLFAAYLNTASLGEAARLQPRIKALLATLIDRYGIREASVVDRSGAYLARVGNVDRTIASLNPKTDPLLLAGFAATPRTAETLMTKQHLNLVAPVHHREQNEFVLSARQDFASYRQALAYGLTADRFVTLTDANGAILSDSRGGQAGGTKILANLTLAQIRKTTPQGHGEVVGGELRYRIAHRKAGDWTIIAVERVPAPRRCHTEGARLCG